MADRDRAEKVWDMIGEGARFKWLEDEGYINSQIQLYINRKFADLPDSIQQVLSYCYDAEKTLA